MYDEARRTRCREEREDSRRRGRVRSRGSERKIERKKGELKRERANRCQRVDRKRSAEKCTTSALVWQLCRRTTAFACKRARE